MCHGSTPCANPARVHGGSRHAPWRPLSAGFARGAMRGPVQLTRHTDRDSLRAHARAPSSYTRAHHETDATSTIARRCNWSWRRCGPGHEPCMLPCFVAGVMPAELDSPKLLAAAIATVVGAWFLLTGNLAAMDDSRFFLNECAHRDHSGNWYCLRVKTAAWVGVALACTFVVTTWLRYRWNNYPELPGYRWVTGKMQRDAGSDAPFVRPKTLAVSFDPRHLQVSLPVGLVPRHCNAACWV